MGVPHIIQFDRIFPYKLSSYWGTPFYGTPIQSLVDHTHKARSLFASVAPQRLPVLEASPCDRDGAEKFYDPVLWRLKTTRYQKGVLCQGFFGQDFWLLESLFPSVQA